MIKFNGTSSGSLGVYVERYPVRTIPQRKVETFSVPGRSGDVVVSEDAWENVEQSYDVYLSAEAAGLPAVAGPVSAWLHGAAGYARLEDDYNPDIFRLAAFAGPADLANILNAFGRGTIKFNCQPQRFLKSGETEISSGTKMVSGAVATFESGIAGLAIVDVSAEIDAVQDLHGYDSPWPAGGGKNKLPDKSYQQTANNLIVGADSNSYTIYLDAGTYTFAVNCTKAVGLYFQRSTDGSSTSVLGSGGSTGVRSGQFTLSEAATCKFWLYVSGGVSAADVSWWQVEKNASFTSYAPYSNVCPITGWTGCTISQSGADTSDPETIAVSWQTEAGTVYGGTLDVTTGLLTVTDANIASYAGETLPGAWISDRDVYSEGGTPTPGAQVVYKLATPVTYQLTPTEVRTLLGENNVWADTGDVTVEYPETSLSLANPTALPAKPLITVHGSSSGTVTIGTQTVTISAITDGMVLDCDLEEAYSISGGVVTNLNSAVSGGFPVLIAGTSAVSWGGGVTGLAIVPRWWEL